MVRRRAIGLTAVERAAEHAVQGVGMQDRSNWVRTGAAGLIGLLVLAGPGAAQQVNCANPMTQVEINFCAEADYRATDAELNRAYTSAREMMRQEALKPYVLAERLPGPDVRTDQEYFDYACRHSKTDHHPAGTCRMGSDTGAVVDPELRFNGIAGLRVADASVMPRVVSSNTNAATIMIAEKAADMIRAKGGQG